MRRAADRIVLGSAVLARRIRSLLADWVARGRRADLTGWRAALGPLARGAVLLAAGYAAVRIVRALPVLLWVVVPAWLLAAWRCAPRSAFAEPAIEEAVQTSPLDPRVGLAMWLLKVIRDRPGVHLYELYPAMRELPGREGLSDPQLRAALRTHGVRVTRSLRVPPVEGRSGVRREDVAALLSPTETGPGEHGGDAGQAPDSPLLSTAGEWAESA